MIIGDWGEANDGTMEVEETLLGRLIATLSVLLMASVAVPAVG
jgi:hypothetical protein